MLTEKQRTELDTGAFGIVTYDAPMREHTTFRIGGPADVLIEPTSEKELLRTVRYLRVEEIPLTIIGNGSNLLVKDGGIRGAVIKLGKHFSDVTIDDTQVRAQAGALLALVSKMSFRAGLTGMEELSGIPGSIGGAVTMNAGAHGREMVDVVESVTCIDEEGNLVVLSNEEMRFRYRHSRVQDEGLIVSSLVLRLKEGKDEEIQSKYDDFTERRTSKQPLEKASAGSTFKRPANGYASKMIDDAGLRGYSYKDAQVSEKHCGFLVNNGDATYEDMHHLIVHVQEEVKRQFDADLEPEVRVIGEDLISEAK